MYICMYVCMYDFRNEMRSGDKERKGRGVKWGEVG